MKKTTEAENPYESPREDNSHAETSRFRPIIFLVVPTFFAGSFALLTGVANGIGNLVLDIRGVSNTPSHQLPWKYANYASSVIIGLLWYCSCISFVKKRWKTGGVVAGIAALASLIAFRLWGLGG